MKKIINALFKPVDIASIVVFRIAFGLIMFWEVWRYVDHHWIEAYFMDPPFHFTYYGFSWVTPWPGSGMIYHFFLMGLLALAIAYGFFYRAATILFFFAFTYFFLLEQAIYLNHLYLVCLISFLMIFIPANRSFSFDSWKNPKLRKDTVPVWALWLLRIQIGIPYFFGGIAKLNWDWLQGEPLRMWLGNRTDLFLIGPYMQKEWAVYFFSYSGLLFDLLIVPCLLWKRTRMFAYICALIFNLTNSQLFHIGIFPWFMIVATTLYFEPSWPRRFFRFNKEKAKNLYPVPNEQKKVLITSLLGVYLFLQFAIPFRHLLYPDTVHWSEEGHRFSWHMKLRDKKSKAEFFIYNPRTNEKKKVVPGQYLTRRQYSNMIIRPDMILQFAHYLAKEHNDDIEVYAKISSSLNGREQQDLIDPNVNLAQEERNLKHAHWILPLN